MFDFAQLQARNSDFVATEAPFYPRLPLVCKGSTGFSSRCMALLVYTGIHITWDKTPQSPAGIFTVCDGRHR
jgi:hypothetical protein